MKIKVLSDLHLEFGCSSALNFDQADVVEKVLSENKRQPYIIYKNKSLDS